MKRLFRISAIVALIIFLSGKTGLSQQQGDEVLFYKHLLMEAWNGVYYGVAADVIFEIKDKAAVALPVITAGTLALVPLFTNESRMITSNQLLLTGHGQLVGWAHGGALGGLIYGDDL